MRKTLFKWHSWFALVAMVPLFVISITGSLLVFKVEIDHLLMPEKSTVQVEPSAQRLPIDELIQSAQNAHPDFAIGSWELFDNQHRADAIYVIKHGTDQWHKMYINQYTGEVLAAPVDVSHYFTDWLLDLHYRFLLGTTGTIVGAVISILFLFLGISGIVLYRNFWKNFFTLRWGKAKRILYSDIHKFTGIISSPIILILAFTGGYWNIAESIHEVTEHAFEEHYLIEAPLHNTDLSLQGMLDDQTQHLSDFKATYMVLPYEPGLNITFYGQVDSANPLHSEYASTLTYDPQNGKLLHVGDVRSNPTLHVIVDSFRKLHFGYFGGLTSKIIWCVIGLSPLILGFTGLYLYLIRSRRIG
ncbi:PepSY domain-containing protein [Psychrosphaera haliotis]|nr:PepSY domain-containing protein [Psychrosphaera haliotis]